MLALPANARLFLCRHPVNMRKSFEGLSKIVEELFPGELLSGSFFIFLNRRKDTVKILFWDLDGFVIWTKRLEQGSFAWKWGKDAIIDRRSLLLVLEGVVPKRIQKRFSIGN